MINEELTFKKFGYHSYNLKPFSNKRVIATCEKCKENREIIKHQDRRLCSKCARKSKERNELISKSRMGQHNSPTTEFKKGIKPISGFKKGQIPWMKDKHHTEEARLKMKLNHANVKGKNCHFYIDGRTELRNLIRNLKESDIWRSKVFKRDDYRCQECFKTNCYIEPHHIKRFSIILGEFLQLYPQFSPIEDKETLLKLAITYQPFWEVSNGKTLCMKCHDKTRGVIKGRKHILTKKSLIEAKERCKILGLAQKNIPKTQEQKIKISNSLKNYYKNNPQKVIEIRAMFKNIVLSSKRDNRGRFIKK